MILGIAVEADLVTDGMICIQTSFLYEDTKAS